MHYFSQSLSIRFIVFVLGFVQEKEWLAPRATEQMERKLKTFLFLALCVSIINVHEFQKRAK